MVFLPNEIVPAGASLSRSLGEFIPLPHLGPVCVLGFWKPFRLDPNVPSMNSHQILNNFNRIEFTKFMYILCSVNHVNSMVQLKIIRFHSIPISQSNVHEKVFVFHIYIVFLDVSGSKSE